MIHIRPAKPTEADILTQIALAAKRHWGYPERWIEVWIPQLTLTPEYVESNECWVAIVEDVPVAFYTVLGANETVSLENLWVLPASMGHGIGKQLFVHAVERARERGYKILQLEADPHAAGFYERMGMHKVGERRTQVDGQPRLLPIMEMVL